MKNCKLFTKVLFIKFVKKNYLMKTYFISWFVALTYFSCTNEKKSDTIAYESNPRPVNYTRLLDRGNRQPVDFV